MLQRARTLASTPGIHSFQNSIPGNDRAAVEWKSGPAVSEPEMHSQLAPFPRKQDSHGWNAKTNQQGSPTASCARMRRAQILHHCCVATNSATAIKPSAYRPDRAAASEPTTARGQLGRPPRFRRLAPSGDCFCLPCIASTRTCLEQNGFCLASPPARRRADTQLGSCSHRR